MHPSLTVPVILAVVGMEMMTDPPVRQHHFFLSKLLIAEFPYDPDRNVAIGEFSRPYERLVATKSIYHIYLRYITTTST